MIVIKFGGHAMKDEHGAFAQAIADAISIGVKPVIVHGGGPQIDQALQAAGINSQWKSGFRVTTPEIFTVVERVLSDEVGPALAQSLIAHGVDAVAISGRNSGTIFAGPRTTLIDGTQADLGLVGLVTSVDATQIMTLVQHGKVPVISPVASDVTKTFGYNVNADFASAAIAGALDAKWLIIMTDVEGIYRNWPDKNSLIKSIFAQELEEMKSTFSDGMAPKAQACLDAIAAGAKAVRIIDGTDPLALKSALLGEGGTLVIA
jgi:acetylglutamate kinase